MSPAITGTYNTIKIAFNKVILVNKGNFNIDKPGALMFKTVAIKFIAPNKLDTPAKWRLKIAKSTDGPECPEIDDNGG